MLKLSMLTLCNSDEPRCQHTAASAAPWWLFRLGRAQCGVLCIALMLLANGCQCFCCGTNAWSSLVDCAPDHAVPFDWCYCPKLDLTRIGRPCGLPGRCCCQCPTDCCQSGAVYAHRWNSPPAPETAPPAGLQGVPDFPAAEPGPYFPPSTSDEVATPLFGPSVEPLARRKTPSRDEGIVRTLFTRESANAYRPEPARQSPAPTWSVPVDAIFGN